MREPESRTYRTTDIVSFRKTDEPFGGLSNMAPRYPIRVGDVEARTAEALYQACRYPHLPAVQAQILSERSPMTAKMRGKPYQDRTRPDWDRIRIPLMKWCLRLKLGQHSTTFGSLLRDTGNRNIVENSRRDDFWGAIPVDDGTLRGRNVLGRLLMELRAKLVAGIEPAAAIEPLPIERFCLLDRPIPSVAIAAQSVHEDEPWYHRMPTDEEAEPLQLYR